MTLQSWLLYLTFVFVATATPGPAILFITTNSLLNGWQKTIFAAIGNIMGLLCLGIVAITGLGAILQTSVVIYGLIRYFGAAYLVFLGIKLFFQKDQVLDQLKPNTHNASPYKLFFQAFGIALSNPKAIIFLTALFPQFINVNEALIPQFSALIFALMLSSFIFLLLYSILAHQARNWLAQSGRAKIVNKTSGSIFIGFGLLLATSSNK